MKHAKFLIAILAVAALVYAYLDISRDRAAGTDGPRLTIEALDVGQGDAIFIETSEKYQILIDGGPDKSILTQLGDAMPFWDRSIDAVVLTHPHSDHVAGLVEVLRRYDVGKVYMTGVLHTSSDYIEFLKLIQEKNITTQIVDAPFEEGLPGGVRLEVLFPKESFSGQRVENLNDTSIVFAVRYGETRALFTGDLGIEGEVGLIMSGQDVAADVLKIGHHGSEYSSDEGFLLAVGAKNAVISVGQGNDFGHPSERTIKRLERAGMEIKRTDLGGTVIFTSDGKNFTF